MSRMTSILFGTLVLLASAAAAAWLVWRTVKKAEDPGRMLFKWILTGVIFAMLIGVGAGSKMSDMGSAFIVPISGAVFGVMLGILWAPNLGALLAKPLTGFYDGGEVEVERRPFYSIARAKQKQGRYPEAIAEVRKQLAIFPEDYEGWILLAEIYGDGLKDNAAAQDCVNELLSHLDHAPRNIAYALNRSADWHLSLAADREEARASLQQIVNRYPDTEFAHVAAQRVAHLATDKMLADQKERPRISLTRHEQNIGLMGEVANPQPKAEPPEAAANRLVGHLNEHPLDADAREELAGIYAQHYQRIDLAADQLEQLITAPGVSQKQIARWLNMLADFHLSLASDRAGAEAALKRIMELFPDSAVAANAEKRIAYMDHELRRHRPTHAVAMGNYEQNLGLKGQGGYGPRHPTSD